MDDLNLLKRQMGELNFSAQYQQEPIPLAGNLIKAQWFREYEIALMYAYNDLMVISIDTAMKGTELADFSRRDSLARTRRLLLPTRSVARTGRLS